VIEATESERAERNRVVAAICEAVRTDSRILMPDFDPSLSQPGESGFTSVGVEPSAYSGRVGGLRYLFEGEDDVLHLMVARTDGLELDSGPARDLAAWLLEGIAPGLVWYKPGRLTHHFYCGHDDLVAAVRRD
jgi:hypothetical protein